MTSLGRHELSRNTEEVSGRGREGGTPGRETLQVTRPWGVFWKQEKGSLVEVQSPLSQKGGSLRARQGPQGQATELSG